MNNTRDVEPSGGGDRGRVLIVEDEVELADLYTIYLEDRHEVTTAYTAEAAMDCLDADPDVVLLDRRLEGSSGDALIPVIDDRGIDCQIAMVTGVTPDVDIVDLGIDEYLTKPVPRDGLVATVEELRLRAEAPHDRRALLALVSKRIALERQNHRDDLEGRDAYATLTDRIERAEGRLEASPEGITADPGRSECANCERGWDEGEESAVGAIQLATDVWKCTRCGDVIGLEHPEDRTVSER